MSKKTGKKTPTIIGLINSLGAPDASTLDSIGLGIYVIDSDLRVIYANKQLVEMIKGAGIRQEDIIGRHVKEAFPFLKKSSIDEYREVLREGKSKFMMSGPTDVWGRIVIAEIRKVPLKQGDRTTHILTTIKDITEDTRNREALSASEEKYRLLVDNVSASIAVIDHDGMFLFINRIGAEALGMPVDEIIGKNHWDVFPREIADRQMENVRKVIDENTGFFEETMSIVNKQQRWYAMNLQPYKDTDGKTIAALVIAHDITNQRKSDEALQHSEETFRLAMESTEDALWDWNIVTNHVYRNPRHAIMLGYDPDEIPPDQKEWEKRVHPDDRENVLKVLKDILERKRESFEVEYRLRAKSGDYIWVLGRGKVVDFAADGSPLRMIGTNTDITERRKADEALRASEEQSRTLINNVQADISVLDRNGNFLFINESSARTMGISTKEVIGKNQAEFFSPEANEIQLRNIRSVIDGGIELREETRVFLNGKWIWYDVNVQPYPHAGGKETAALVIAIDITDRKEADTALRESEERFRMQFEYFSIPAYIWKSQDDDFTFIDYNKAADSITNGHIKEFRGQKASVMYAHMPDVRADMKQCLGEKKTITREMESSFMTAGKTKYLIAHYVYIPPDFVVVHTEDITQRKKTEDALRQAHDDLETRVIKRTEELAEVNEALRVDRELLKQKNIALKEVLEQFEEGKRQMAEQIQLNIGRIVMPILKSLENKVRPAGIRYIELLRGSLDDIAAPLIKALETRFAHLTPRELEICNMVKSGLTCKEIADTLNTSPQTVLKQRTIIRKKLGISHSKTNLASYLKSLES